MENLDAIELVNLINTVFPRLPEDDKLLILIDVPDDQVPDNPIWRMRRKIARYWYYSLMHIADKMNLSGVGLFYYQNTHNNNADLPEFGWDCIRDMDDLTPATLNIYGKVNSFKLVFQQHQLFLVPTEFSATAPMKLMAREFGFRAATMPGFNPLMIPALRLDWNKIYQRVNMIKALLDKAVAADIRFLVDGSDSFDLHLDLRYRQGQASGGIFPHKGTAGNLPSGECFIVPYEGELKDLSESIGLLPVQFGNEIVSYQINRNRAVAVTSKGKKSASEAKKIDREPAYSNIAELGFGILADFGIKPIGEVLLDEKLGLHIAFGRSDHFGGTVGVRNFSSPDAVEHSDRIYIPATQNRIQILYVILTMEDASTMTLMLKGNYTIF